MSPPNIDKALEATSALKDRAHRNHAIIYVIINRLLAMSPPRIVNALAASKTLEDSDSRDFAIKTIVDMLLAVSPPNIVNALEVARTIENKILRDSAIKRIIDKHLATPTPDIEAFLAAKDIDPKRADVITHNIIDRLLAMSPPNIDKALEFARAIKDQSWRNRAFEGITKAAETRCIVLLDRPFRDISQAHKIAAIIVDEPTRRRVEDLCTSKEKRIRRERCVCVLGVLALGGVFTAWKSGLFGASREEIPTDL